jgi:hypothetical protein
MKNKLSLISFCALFSIPFVAPWEGASLVRAGHATEGINLIQVAPQEVRGAASFLPVFDLDMSGLEVRDAQNKPVKSASAVQNLTELFTSSLFQLTVAENPHGIRQIWNDLALFSHLFNNLIFNIFYPPQKAIPNALLPSIKRFVHNVHNLWIALSVGLFLSAILIAPIFKNSSCQHLILRC